MIFRHDRMLPSRLFVALRPLTRQDLDFGLRRSNNSTIWGPLLRTKNNQEPLLHKGPNTTDNVGFSSAGSLGTITLGSSGPIPVYGCVTAGNDRA